jgi:hypothetical protein
MESWDDACALCKNTKDKFYLSAFSIECWLGKLANSTVAQYAEERSANRRKLQVGESRRIFAEVFKHTNDRDFSSLFVYLARFANADGPYSYALRQGYWAISEEGEFPPLRQLVRGYTVRTHPELQRRFVHRLCDWLDAITHWRIHERYYLSPVSFDADPDKRELAVIGWQQRHFSKLDNVSKAYWQLHHGQTAQRFRNSSKWATVGKVMSSEATRYHGYLALDQLVIWLWPVVKKHTWTYRDLLNVIWMIPSQRKSYPCRREEELATYCNNVLGLRKESTGKTARNGRPEGSHVAMSLLALS